METSDTTAARWSRAQKILFRFGFVYVVLYALEHPFGAPFGDLIESASSFIWDRLVPWVGAHVLALSEPITIFPAGSGDTTYNYVQIFTLLVLAAVGCLIWTLLDRKRPNYDKLLSWFTLGVRYYLAFVLLAYGFVKVIKVQFGTPSLERLVTPFGETSPMGLLWSFMGHSTPYTMFTGLGEVTAGLLLFFRRTTTLGALVAFGVMLHVMMLNFSYDVPVKLFSTHLVLLATFLILRDINRIANFFVLNRATEPVALRPLFSKRWMNRAALAFKVIVIGYVVVTGLYGARQSQKQWGHLRSQPALYGLYEVETFVQNGDTLAAVLTDTTRWRRLIVEWPGRANIHAMDNTRLPY
ncbi:MAG TPA: hypothetical protein VKP65_10185, partial [Rhodothermales bacterium]|nr:hypothetical protein [Rhodothermales bacterium]